MDEISMQNEPLYASLNKSLSRYNYFDMTGSSRVEYLQKISDKNGIGVFEDNDIYAYALDKVCDLMSLVVCFKFCALIPFMPLDFAERRY